MDIPDLTRQVQAFFLEHAVHWGLTAEQTRAEYVLNWGGFVNHSFTITDGDVAYHLKLAGEEQQKQSLRRWQRFHERLETHYHAPQLIGWFDLPGASLGGLLFHHIEGHTPDLKTSPALLREVIEMTSRLHADAQLREQLLLMDGERTCFDHFFTTYVERFKEDLAIITNETPPFVTPETLQWMQEETSALEASARGSDAFFVTTTAPVHGDLWEDNILVPCDGEWVLLDWDDLSLGDPALDYVILLGPLLSPDESASWHDWPAPINDPGFSERMALYLRASRFDRVVDVLADYIEAAVIPGQREMVRERKQEEHFEALSRHQELYVSTPHAPWGPSKRVGR